MSKRMDMAALAALAGVDVSTVSRALRGDRRRVAAATIERIQRLALEVDYVADPVAASLRSKRSGMIGVLVPHLTDVVVAEIFESIANRLSDLGYLALVTPTGGSSAVRRRVSQGFIRRRVDGVIVADASLREAAPDDLVTAGVPMVFALRTRSDQLSVGADDHLGGRLAAEHLLALGHRDIYVISGPYNTSTGRSRLSGFRSALHDAGLTLPNDRLVRTGFGVDEGFQAMDLLLAGGRRPTAVFAANDYNAIGAAHALTRAGLVVGTDTSLIGYNDIHLNPYLHVPLTSVRTDSAAIGRTAADLIAQKIEGKSPSSVITPPRLIVRRSTQPARRMDTRN
jgi:LacI family transcriptional regulator, galactose operon repressor